MPEITDGKHPATLSLENGVRALELKQLGLVNGRCGTLITKAAAPSGPANLFVCIRIVNGRSASYVKREMGGVDGRENFGCGRQPFPGTHLESAVKNKNYPFGGRFTAALDGRDAGARLSNKSLKNRPVHHILQLRMPFIPAAKC